MRALRVLFLLATWTYDHLLVVEVILTVSVNCPRVYTSLSQICSFLTLNIETLGLNISSLISANMAQPRDRLRSIVGGSKGAP